MTRYVADLNRTSPAEVSFRWKVITIGYSHDIKVECSMKIVKTCGQGYSSNGASCTDIDECANGTHNCFIQATCSNTVGSFTCACNPGYSGDGVSCTCKSGYFRPELLIVKEFMFDVKGFWTFSKPTGTPLTFLFQGLRVLWKDNVG